MALIGHCGLESLVGYRRRAGGPGIVHRLDKDTSGSSGRCQDQMRRITAWTQSFLPTTAARLPLERDLFRFGLGRAGAAGRHGRGGARASSDRPPEDGGGALRSGAFRRDPLVNCSKAFQCRVLGTRRSRGASIACTLETGRTHQIRVHMAHLGHPVLGDPLYAERLQDERGAARARKLKALLQALEPPSASRRLFSGFLASRHQRKS